MPDELQLISRTQICADPGDLARMLLLRKELPGFYFEQPSRGFAIAALGVAAEFRGAGEDRFLNASAAALALLRSIRSESGAHPVEPPLVVGGFGFSDQDSFEPQWRGFPAAWLLVPQLVWVRRNGSCTLTRTWRGNGSPDEALSQVLSRDGAPDAQAVAAPPLPAPPSATAAERDRWCERVKRVRTLIESGALSKVVLSRRRELEFSEPPAPLRLAAAARKLRPTCFTFWMRAGETPSSVPRPSCW